MKREVRILYNILGVSRNATQEEIKTAYRRKCIELHPDKNNGNCKTEYSEVQLAYTILSDVEKREQYDEIGSLQEYPELDAKEQAIDILIHWIGDIINFDLKAITNIDLIKYLNDTCLQKEKEINNNELELISKKIALENIKKKIRKKKDGRETYIEDIIDDKIIDMETLLSQTKFNKSVIRNIKYILNNYKSVDDMFAMNSSYLNQNLTTTSTA